MWNRTNTVIKFLQTVVTGKTDYSQPLNIVEQLTNCRHWWQDQITENIMLDFAVKCLTGNIDMMRTMAVMAVMAVSYTQIAEIPDGRDIAKKHLPGCIHHASMEQYRPLGGDDQWRGHIAPGQWHGCAAQNHRTDATT